MTATTAKVQSEPETQSLDTMDAFFAYARRLTAFVWNLTADERLPEDVREAARKVLETDQP